MNKESLGSQPLRHPSLDGLVAIAWRNAKFRSFSKMFINTSLVDLREWTEHQENATVNLKEWTEHQYEYAKKRNTEAAELRMLWNHCYAQVKDINWSNQENLTTNERKFNARINTIVVSLLIDGTIYNVNDLRKIPDNYLSNISNFGKVKIAAIRQKYPYDSSND